MKTVSEADRIKNILFYLSAGMSNVSDVQIKSLSDGKVSVTFTVEYERQGQLEERGK